MSDDDEQPIPGSKPGDYAWPFKAQGPGPKYVQTFDVGSNGDVGVALLDNGRVRVWAGSDEFEHVDLDAAELDGFLLALQAARARL